MLRGSSQARPGGRRPTRRYAPLLGWLAAAVVLAALAFIVGRPSGEQDRNPATPAPSDGPVEIEFGSGLDSASGKVTDPTRRFGPGATFAYSVTLPVAFEADAALVKVVRLDEGRSEVQAPTAEPIDATGRTFGVTFPADRVLDAWGPGEYEMTITLRAGGPIVARGRFVLLGP